MVLPASEPNPFSIIQYQPRDQATELKKKTNIAMPTPMGLAQAASVPGRLGVTVTVGWTTGSQAQATDSRVLTAGDNLKVQAKLLSPSHGQFEGQLKTLF